MIDCKLRVRGLYFYSRFTTYEFHYEIWSILFANMEQMPKHDILRKKL